MLGFLTEMCMWTISLSFFLTACGQAPLNTRIVGGVSGLGWMEESEDPIAGGKRLLLTKQMNKQKLPRRGKNKLAGWLASRQGRAGLDKAGQDTDDIWH